MSTPLDLVPTQEPNSDGTKREPTSVEMNLIVNAVNSLEDSVELGVGDKVSFEISREKYKEAASTLLGLIDDAKFTRDELNQFSEFILTRRANQEVATEVYSELKKSIDKLTIPAEYQVQVRQIMDIVSTAFTAGKALV